ncbi:hypothetical protein Salat_1847100 [Sesamum alatum]|uniref:Uncharacterized protein n=1 Tax=Sesamum alatum TaxID=300844 RepID=A0AAE2CHQ0_9LAMI|nr:hypothetical protein Salat_1847100 [Sesamum alatum]
MLIQLPVPVTASISVITQFQQPQPLHLSSSSTRIMRLNSSPIPFLLIIMLIILSIGRLSTCRVITDNPTTSDSHSPPLSWYFPQPADHDHHPKESRNDEELNYRVSHRKTPAGPNPLHN